jgi:hypothetical protein
MAAGNHAAGDEQDRTARPRSRLFAVRLWTEDVAGGPEYRGSVRDVLSGAFRGFRDWTDLADFMIEQMTDEEPTRTGRVEGGLEWPSQLRR